jgi:hypothetical protein
MANNSTEDEATPAPASTAPEAISSIVQVQIEPPPLNLIRTRANHAYYRRTREILRALGKR